MNKSMIYKEMRIGTVQYGRKRVSVYLKAKITDGKFSISGVIGPTKDGNAVGSCGQIQDDFKRRGDVRESTYLFGAKEINFAPGWNAEKFFQLLDIWDRWHLNDMRAGCEHQFGPGWEVGQECQICGYKYGHEWKSNTLPAYVGEFIESLPSTDKEPAWV